jgi:hypothetical protein
MFVMNKAAVILRNDKIVVWGKQVVVEALCYKPEDRRFKTPCGELISFQFT